MPDEQGNQQQWQAQPQQGQPDIAGQQQYHDQQQHQQPQQGYPPQQPTAYPQQQGGQYPQQAPYQQPQQPAGQYQQSVQQYGMSQPNQYGQYGTAQGDFMTEQPQPTYGQMPYGQGYGMGQPQPGYGYPQQYQMGGIPMQQGGYDPLAKNAWISLGLGVGGILLLLFGWIWGIFVCCGGIVAGIKGMYSRARVAAIIGIVLNSLLLLLSMLSFLAQCAELFS